MQVINDLFKKLDLIKDKEIFTKRYIYIYMVRAGMVEAY